ncbi:MAG TPA: polysaccharide deacetylase family protein [Flavisolibacter sp.]|nr:polysaccharide deacetylase family protein [Flavisolibacter sp.]
MYEQAKRIGGWFLASLLIVFGFVKRRREKLLNEECILSLCFHHPSKKQFEQCIKWLKKYGFHFLSATDVEKIIQYNLPFPKGGVVMTLDDGWQSNETDVIEVANAYGVPVTIFVSTEPVEEGTYWFSYVNKAKQLGVKHPPKQTLKKWPNEKRLLMLDEIKKVVSLKREAMTVDQIRKAAESPWVTLGAHTHTHPILINCNDRQVYEELQVSKQKMEEWIGKEVRYFAYPNGDYSSREVETLKSLNYGLAFTTKKQYLVPASLKRKYELPRFMLLEEATFAENICRMLGIWNSMTHSFKRVLSQNKK